MSRSLLHLLGINSTSQSHLHNRNRTITRRKSEGKKTMSLKFGYTEEPWHPLKDESKIVLVDSGHESGKFGSSNRRFIDSRCTFHLTFDRCAFTSYTCTLRSSVVHGARCWLEDWYCWPTKRGIANSRQRQIYQMHYRKCETCPTLHSTLSAHAINGKAMSNGYIAR